MGPPLVVVLVAGVLWLASGVALSDICLFLLYEAVFVVGPGWVVYSALRPCSDAVERLAFGWALGYALEIGAFGLTAALDVRTLFFAYPAVVGAFAVRRGRSLRPRTIERGPAVRRWNWLVAAIATLAVFAVAISLFPPNPLPGTVPRVTYFLDNIFQISLAAEALHHWPLTDPTVAGGSFPYHTFVHMHMAAVAQTTGIALPVVVLRLVPLPLVALFAFQMALAGTRIAGRRWIGPIAAVLVLLVGEFDFDPRGGLLSTPFLGTFFVGLWYSPTFLLGLVFFVPLLVLLIELVVEHKGQRTSRDWISFAMFAAGAAGAKAAILPVVVAGLTLFLLVRRRLERAGAIALLLSGSIFVAFLATMYRGGNAGMRLDFSAGAVGSGAQLVVSALSGLPNPLAIAAGVVFGFLGLFGAPLSGLAWFVPQRSALKPAYVLLLCLFAAALVPYFLILEPGASELFFVQYGFVAAVLVSAVGIYWLWHRSAPRTPRTQVVAAFTVAWSAALIVLSAIPVLVTASDETLYLIWYGCLGSVLAMLGAGAARSRPAARGLWIRLLLITILSAAALNVPLDIAPHLVQEWRKGTLYVHGGTGLTPDLYRGLEWIRDRTRPDDVIAVSNYSVNGSEPSYDDVYYSAFAERRTFLEGWAYGMKTLRRGPHYHTSLENMPYPERLRLNEAVFRRGDRAALRTLVRDYHVRYLVVDRVHRRATKVSSVGRLVFSNPDVAIYAVSGRASPS